jgi:hypothetical protein
MNGRESAETLLEALEQRLQHEPVTKEFIERLKQVAKQYDGTGWVSSQGLYD